MFVYVVGGVVSTSAGQPADLYDTVYRARVRGDGGLEAWEAEPDLPVPLAFHATATVGRSIVLAGGVSHDGSRITWVPDLFVANVDDDGHVSEWTAAAGRVAAPALHATLLSRGERLYLVGGGAGASSELNDTADSYAVTLDEAGVFVTALGERRAEATLPSARSHHAAVVHGGRLWLAGGLSAGGGDPTAVLASIMDGAAIVGWEALGSLSEPPFTSASILSGDTLWLVGGGFGDAYTARIRGVVLGEVADEGPDTFALPFPRAHVHQTPTHGGWMDTIGGRVLEGSALRTVDDVFRAPAPE